jgi:hypothetical protein
VTWLLDTPELDFRHIQHMTDERGTFEHALFSQPRPEHGYCTDDMARVLVVTSRERSDDPAIHSLALLSVKFLAAALDVQGMCRNRLSRTGAWQDRPTVEDCWGRSIWGLGTAVAHSNDGLIRHSAARALHRAMGQRSPWPRAMAFAALGAADVLSVDPESVAARALLRDATNVISQPDLPTRWPWPEHRLTYANAVLPDAMIAAGVALDRPALVRRGLDLLNWLLERETQQGHLSVTAAGGSGPGDHGPAFDQQPIEVAALADACARAATVDADRRWMEGTSAAANWFVGANDGGTVMWDPTTGGAFDGLEIDGANLNQGTESTLALLSTLQHARSVVHLKR